MAVKKSSSFSQIGWYKSLYCYTCGFNFDQPSSVLVLVCQVLWLIDYITVYISSSLVSRSFLPPVCLFVVCLFVVFLFVWLAVFFFTYTASNQKLEAGRPGNTVPNIPLG